MKSPDLDQDQLAYMEIDEDIQKQTMRSLYRLLQEGRQFLVNSSYVSINQLLRYIETPHRPLLEIFPSGQDLKILG